MSSQPIQLVRKSKETEERQRLVRRARLLAWAGVGWHGIEAAVAGRELLRHADRRRRRGRLLRRRLLRARPPGRIAQSRYDRLTAKVVERLGCPYRGSL